MNNNQLQKNFNTFKHEHKDLLMPYFNALGLKGEEAFQAYKKRYNYNQTHFPTTTGDHFLYAMMLAGGSFFIVTAIEVNRNNPLRATFKKSIKSKHESLLNRALYYTKETILQDALYHKENEYKDLKRQKTRDLDAFIL